MQTWLLIFKDSSQLFVNAFFFFLEREKKKSQLIRGCQLAEHAKELQLICIGTINLIVISNTESSDILRKSETW